MGVHRRRLLLGKRKRAFTLTATTTGAAETVTIKRLTVDRPTALQWGDGSGQVLPADSEASIDHEYASAGTYNVRLADARRVTQLYLDSAKLGGLDTAQLAQSAITYFWVSAITDSTIDSQHMSGWSPDRWYLYSMPAGDYTIDSQHMSGWSPSFWYLYDMPAGTYTIDSQHMSGWSPDRWKLFSMPAGDYTIDSQHMSGWTPDYWYLYDMPAGTYTIDSQHMSGWSPSFWWLYNMPTGDTGWTISAADFAGFTSCTSFQCYDNGLSTTQVDALLWGMYQASVAPRTASSGTINVGGTNDAPSGTYQAAAACPVDATTDGKEVAHELLNDGCGEGFNVWATVDIT